MADKTKSRSLYKEVKAKAAAMLNQNHFSDKIESYLQRIISVDMQLTQNELYSIEKDLETIENAITELQDSGETLHEILYSKKNANS